MQAQALPGFGLHKLEVLRMQAEPLGLDRKIAPEGEFRFAKQWVADIFKMYPYLIGPAGPGRNLNHGKILPSLDNLIAGLGRKPFYPGIDLAGRMR
jgi:hypothetical protein